MMKNKVYIFTLIAILTFLFSCSRSDTITEDEKEWLNQHQNLVVGLSPNSPPYQFINENGEIVGIFIDFLRIIEKEIDYKFKRTYNSDFSKLLEGTKTGTIDVLLENQETEERKTFLKFTPSLVSHNHIILVRNSVNDIENIDDLEGRKIAVVNKFAIQEYLSNEYPTYTLMPLIDDVECLQAVLTGQVDAYICQQAIATYYINKDGISGLKIVGEVNYRNELAIASRKSLDTLNTILTKAVNSISNKERQQIYSNWLSFTVKPFYHEAKFLVTIFSIFIIIIFLAISFNRILQKKVKQKTKELNQSNKELLISKEKAEESDLLKSAFLANMSHEIRTPMNGILGFAQLLKEPNLTGKEQQKYISIIEKGGARMLNIINDIVNISKIESGLMEVNIQESNINEQIEFIYTFFKPEIEAKGLQFSFRNALPSKEAILKTDCEKVYVILTNLVKNAIKYSEKGSIEFGYNIKGNDIEFYVKDTGIGIPKDRQGSIFERFIQADIADKNAYQGAGLGLSISKAYVEMLGGEIRVESKLDEGSSFYFTLPYQSEAIQVNKTKNEIRPPAKESSVNKLKILIVEDDQASEELISITVRKFGKEIIIARTGSEAVEACLKNPDIDLVLMDIQLPQMNGYEATREIRKFDKDVIIIAQTAYALLGDKEKVLEAGCNDYISKPIKADELKQMIIKCVSDKCLVISSTG